MVLSSFLFGYNKLYTVSKVGYMDELHQSERIIPVRILFNLNKLTWRGY